MPWIKKRFLENNVGTGVRQTFSANEVVYPFRFLALDSNNEVGLAPIEENQCIGVLVNDSRVLPGGEAVVAITGSASVELDQPVVRGDLLKVYRDGKVGPAFTPEKAATLITSGVANAIALFLNQPSGDAIELVSSSVADVSDVIVYGTTNGTTTLVKETVTLNGTTPVASSKSDWGDICAFEIAKSSPLGVGTITLREASGDATIKTLAAGSRSAGILTVPLANRSAYLSTVHAQDPVSANSGTLGLLGTDENNDELLAAITMDDANDVYFDVKFRSVEKILMGDFQIVNAVSVSRGHLAEDLTRICGMALESGSEGDVISAMIYAQEAIPAGQLCLNQLSNNIAAAAKSILTNGRIDDLNTIPYVIVPRPGPGRAIVFLGALLHHRFVTTAWTVGASDDISINYSDGSGQILGQCETIGFLDQSNDEYRWVDPDALAKTIQEDEPLVLFVSNADPTGGGTSKLGVKVYYRIVDINLID